MFCKRRIYTPKCRIVLLPPFNLLSQGHKKVAGLWAASGLQWSDFVPRNQVDQFLAEKVSQIFHVHTVYFSSKCTFILTYNVIFKHC